MLRDTVDSDTEETCVSIVYMRSDGWWEAGYGFETRDIAFSAGHDHSWRGTAWAVVESARVTPRLLPGDEPTESERGDSPPPAPAGRAKPRTRGKG